MGIEVGELDVGTLDVGEFVENSAVVVGTDDDGTDDEGTEDGADDGVLLVGSADQVGDEDEGRLLGADEEGAKVFKSFIVKSARPTAPLEIVVAMSLELKSVALAYCVFTSLSVVWSFAAQSLNFASFVHA